MAIGDDAVAAGMALVVGAADLVKDGADHHNLTRDYVAQRTSAITPVAKGGTGASNPGGARANLGAAAVSHTHTPEQIGHGTLDVGPTGYVLAGGGMNSFGARNLVITNGPATAAIAADGVFGIVASSQRYKQDDKPRVYTLAQAAQIGRLVVEYRYIEAVANLGDAAPVVVGIIAERLLAAGFPEFVVFDLDGEVQSIHYSEMITVSLSALVEVEERLVKLEGKVS